MHKNHLGFDVGKEKERNQYDNVADSRSPSSLPPPLLVKQKSNMEPNKKSDIVDSHSMIKLHTFQFKKE